MRSIEALQALVVSLSKSEKRYFKLFCDRQEGDKAYWRLYQVLEEEPPDAARVREAFGRYHPLPLLKAAPYSLFRLLHLLVHYELGNLDYLGYEVRSVERQLRTRKWLFRSEQVLLHFFKKSAKGGRTGDLLPALHAQLAELGQDAYEKQLLGSFPFAAWAAAKGQKVPFAQWLRQKAASG
jgi:hypothetical protein